MKKYFLVFVLRIVRLYRVLRMLPGRKNYVNFFSLKNVGSLTFRGPLDFVHPGIMVVTPMWYTCIPYTRSVHTSVGSRAV